MKNCVPAQKNLIIYTSRTHQQLTNSETTPETQNVAMKSIDNIALSNQKSYLTLHYCTKPEEINL